MYQIESEHPVSHEVRLALVLFLQEFEPFLYYELRGWASRRITENTLLAMRGELPLRLLEVLLRQS